MRKLPGFFLEHDLTADADERAVKRAYAKALKKIDQENDLDGFQSLRESYERALAWMRYRDAGIQFEFTELEIQAEERQEPEAPAESTTAFNPRNIAQQVFDAMLRDMQAHPGKDDYAGERFLQALDDERLIHMETSLAFEQMIAHYLFQGWLPGNGELFDVAAQRYGWAKDSRRLLNLGGAAYVIDRALIEANTFHGKDKKARHKQWEIVLRIRAQKSPKKSYLKANLGMLMHMQDSYPAWLPLVTRQEHLEQWLTEAEVMKAQIPHDRQTRSNDTNMNSRPVYWLVFICVMALGMFFREDKPRPKYQFDPASYSVDTPDHLLTPDQKRAKAETLLVKSVSNKDLLYQAIQTLEHVANAKDANAAYRLGWLYRDGKYAQRDTQKQQQWFLKAAELGDLQSRVIVGDYFLDGLGGKIDHQEALRHFKIAADKGYALGQFKLAFMIDHGFAIKKDRAEVARLIKASAEQGFAYSESLMGQFHLRGEYGYPRDDVKAANWFSLSAKHGHASGERYFGLVHEQGLGPYKINLGEAAKWYAKARDHGEKDAEKSLLRMCKKQEFPECKPTPTNIKPVAVVTRVH